MLGAAVAVLAGTLATGLTAAQPSRQPPSPGAAGAAGDGGPPPGVETGLIVALEPAAPGWPVALGPAAARAELARLLDDAVPATIHPAFAGHLSPPAPGGAAGARGALQAASRLAAIQLVTFETAAARAAAIRRLRGRPEVRYVEPLRAVQLEGAAAPVAPGSGAFVRPPAGGGPPAPLEPGDPLFSEQWALPVIGMPEVWESATGTPGILVAVVDTGIELAHPDLLPNLARNAAEAAGVAGVDDDGNGFVDDVDGWDFMAGTPSPNDGYGHGTHVAGIIGAASDGAFGIVGVTWTVELLPVKMFTDRGVGTNLSGAEGIVYGADRGARIINMSWSTPTFSRVIGDAVDYASERGVVLVGSAGNSAASVLEFYPAGLDAVITVGATGPDDRYASFSNRGPRLDLVAPGVNILSSWRGRHLAMSGTSQAAPHVSGVAAHLLSRHPSWSPEQVRAALLLGAHDLGRVGWEPTFGYGRLDAAAALAVEDPPVALIRAPRTLAAIAAGPLELRGDVRGPGASGLLELGSGEDPRSWTELWHGGAGVDQRFGWLDTDPFSEGTYTLRLAVTTGTGAEVAARVVFRVDRTAPELEVRDDVQQLAGGRLRQLVRIRADERVRITSFVRERGSAEPFEEQRLDDFEATRALDFSDRLPGTYEYALLLEDLAGTTTRVPSGGGLLEREVLPPIDVPGDALRAAGRLDGFELGVVADIDGDGLPELLGEQRAPGAASGPLRILGLAGALPDYRERFTGLEGLPLDAQDIDADGVMDVLVADSLSSAGEDGSTIFSIYSGFLGDAPPQLVARWRDGDRRFGGGFVDSDGDGRGEVLYAGSAAAELKLLELRDGELVPVELHFESPVPRTAGFAIDDFDGDGLTEIALGTLAGDVLVLEYDGPGGDRLVETYRRPLRGGLANAVIATAVPDADGDGRPEFAISTVGVISDREEHPAVVLFEASGNDTYRESAWFEVRDKNNPFDNALSTTDLTGDGDPELLVAMAGDVYLLDAAGNDRYLPTWHMPRAGGGRVLSADLDRDGNREVLVVERTAAGPVTTLFERRPEGTPPVLDWDVRERRAGVVIRWQAPPAGVTVADLAIYRLAGEVPARPLESDLAERRIHLERGPVVAAGSFADAPPPDSRPTYFLAYTREDAAGRRRVLGAGRTPQALPLVPRLVLGAPQPTPFRDTVELAVELTADAPVAIRIFDVQGRLLRLLRPAAPLPAGAHRINWDGRDAGGRALPAGVYFLRVTSPLGDHARKLVRLP